MGIKTIDSIAVFHYFDDDDAEKICLYLTISDVANPT
jgi:hypothetical protein